MSVIKLIIGLGNPGQEYHRTRHNVGFDFVDEMARLNGFTLASQSKFFGEVGQGLLENRMLRFAKPMTFMNLSGKSVQSLANFYNINPEEILVVHDELDLPPGTIRFKTGGGHGGHNGLRDIIDKLGNEKGFHRLRIGIGHPGHKSKVHGYVLKRAQSDDQVSIDRSIEAGIKHLPLMLKGDFQNLMQSLHSTQFGAV